MFLFYLVLTVLNIFGIWLNFEKLYQIFFTNFTELNFIYFL